MAEFGHTGTIGGGVCLDTWGAGPFEIEVGGKVHRFEDSDRFGPLALSKRDAPLDRQWGERHPFWMAHRAWKRQGRRLAEDGRTCIWEPLRPTKVMRIGRSQHVIVIEHGDEGGPTEFVMGVDHG
jgi:hypothetical protein